MLEHPHRARVGHRLAALAQVRAELVGLGLDLLDQPVVDQPVAAQVDLQPRDRVLQLPGLHVRGEPVARGVVGRGVRTHPVRVGLDERRALAVTGPLEGGLRDGVRRQHVVAVDPDAREAEAQRALVERDAGLALDRLRDRPLVVLAEEDDRRVVGGGEDEGLVDVALRGRAVAKVRDHRGVAVGVAGADDAVALHAHGVARGVQALGADDDRVEPEVVLVRVPRAVVDAAEETEQLERVDALAPGDAVLAVGREDVVLRAQGAAGADLRGLLAEQLGPDAELAVALQGGGLGVDAPGQHHVAVEAADLLRGEVEVELRVVDALALGGEELDQLGAAVALAGSEDLDQVGTEGPVRGVGWWGHLRWSPSRRPAAGSPCRGGGSGAPRAGSLGWRDCDPGHIPMGTNVQPGAGGVPTRSLRSGACPPPTPRTPRTVPPP